MDYQTNQKIFNFWYTEQVHRKFQISYNLLVDIDVL